MATKTNVAQMENGINITQMTNTVEAIKATPSLAKFNFRSSSRWGGGVKSKAYVKSFYGAGQEDTSRKETFTMEGDEPAVLLGTNTGPNAAEALLSALAGCLTASFILPASAQGIKVDSLEFNIDGNVDLQGFLQLQEGIRPGFQNIRVRASVKADASRQKIQEIFDHAVKTSAVMDTIRNPVPVSVELA